MVQRIDFQGGVIIWYKDTTKTTTMQEKTENLLHLLRIFLHRFRVASGREMPYTYHTHAIHIPYTYHTLEHGYNMAS